MRAADAKRRATDAGWLCAMAMRMREFWDWIDRRQIDAYAVTLVILYGTVDIMRWAMHFAEIGNRPGLEVAAIVGAITGPYSILQGAAIKFLFDARQHSFLPPPSEYTASTTTSTSVKAKP